MWRDPLDELIETLESTMPSSTSQQPYELLPRIEELQMVIAPILFGTPEDQRRIEQTPLFHRVVAQLTAQAERWKKYARRKGTYDRASVASEIVMTQKGDARTVAASSGSHGT